MSKFQERLRELRGSLLQDEFAAKIGISRTSLSYYENGNRIPDIETLKRIHEETGISLYYLLGLTDSKDDSLATAQRDTGLNEETIEVLSQNPLYQRVIEKLVCSPSFDRLAILAAAFHDEMVLGWAESTFGDLETDDITMFSSLYEGYNNRLEQHMSGYFKDAFCPADDDVAIGAPTESLPTYITRKAQSALKKAASTDSETKEIIDDIMHVVAGLLDSDYFYDKEGLNAKETPEQ